MLDRLGFLRIVIEPSPMSAWGFARASGDRVDFYLRSAPFSSGVELGARLLVSIYVTV